MASLTKYKKRRKGKALLNGLYPERPHRVRYEFKFGDIHGYIATYTDGPKVLPRESFIVVNDEQMLRYGEKSKVMRSLLQKVYGFSEETAKSYHMKRMYIMLAESDMNEVFNGN